MMGLEPIKGSYAMGRTFSFLSRPDLDLDDWLARISTVNDSGRPPLCKKVMVAKELKWEVRDKLDHANLQERVLFPGLDGLSAWLKRWYTPKRSVGGPAPTRRHPGREDPT